MLTMLKMKIVRVFLIVFAFGTFVNGDKYLKEAPAFLQPCHIHGQTDSKCLSRAFENLFTNWRDGVPGLEGIGRIDPFHIKKLRFSQRTENFADIRAELTDAVAVGLSNLKLLKTSINEKDYTFKFLIHLPKLDMESNYKVKGRILVLNLDGRGQFKCNLSDVEYLTVAKANLKKIDDEYFFEISSIKSNINSIGKFHIEFTNLFGGNKELEDSANQLFNESWREIFDIMRPTFSETLDVVTLDRYKKILGYIPARFFIDDLP